MLQCALIVGVQRQRSIKVLNCTLHASAHDVVAQAAQVATHACSDWDLPGSGGNPPRRVGEDVSVSMLSSTLQDIMMGQLMAGAQGSGPAHPEVSQVLFGHAPMRQRRRVVGLKPQCSVQVCNGILGAGQWI